MLEITTNSAVTNNMLSVIFHRTWTASSSLTLDKQDLAITKMNSCYELDSCSHSGGVQQR